MKDLYDSELHQFVEMYFKATGATIIETHPEYFVVVLANGATARYTYLPRIASENKEIKLLAKGSKELRAMVQDCSSRAAVSEVKASYSAESVLSVLRRKKCCDLCPFVTICDREDGCCDFCYNYKNCNTSIENADFKGLNEIKDSTPVNAIGFIFHVELSNDYSLSQKIQKSLTILIDLETGETINNILARDLTQLKLEPWTDSSCLDPQTYAGYLKTAREGAEEMLKEQLDVFKREIEGPLQDKIVAITTKFEEDYAENYAKSTLEQLEQLQSEAVTLCEREIRGYTLNCSYHLKNAIIFHTTEDVRNMTFTLKTTGKEVEIPGNFFLGRVDIPCSDCGSEIDTGVICDAGHVLCKNCMESCTSCHKVICNQCDHESFVCSTCGETTCTDCVQKCSSCGAVVCPSHAYACVTCGNIYCIDCYEVCNVCGDNICKEHIQYCSHCNEPVCSQHSHNCSTCGQLFCDDHIDKCSICGSLLCEDHSHTSAYSGNILCQDHIATCAVCSDTFAANEIKSCSKCEDALCPSHYKQCSKCHSIYCSKHINHCRGCGSEICDCTPFQKCSLCGEEFCPDCLNAKGHCKACASLTSISSTDSLVSRAADAMPVISKFKSFYIGKSKELLVLYCKGLLNGYIVTCSYNGDLISSRELGFMENLKARGNTIRKGG